MIVTGAYMPYYITSRLKERIERVEDQWASYRERELEVDRNCYRESTTLRKNFKLCLLMLTFAAYCGSNTRDPFPNRGFIVPLTVAAVFIFGSSFYLTFKSIQHMQKTIGPDSWPRIRTLTSLRYLNGELDQTSGVLLDVVEANVTLADGVSFDAVETTVTLAEAKDRVQKMMSTLRTPPKHYLMRVIVTYGFALTCFLFLIRLIVFEGVFKGDDLRTVMGGQYTAT